MKSIVCGTTSTAPSSNAGAAYETASTAPSSNAGAAYETASTAPSSNAGGAAYETPSTAPRSNAGGAAYETVHSENIEMLLMEFQILNLLTVYMEQLNMDDIMTRKQTTACEYDDKEN
jgi:hypothetical protein